MGWAVYPGLRSPMGRFGGAYRDLSPMRIMAEVIQSLSKRMEVPLSDSAEVFLGQCRQAGHGPNPARSAALWAGIPSHVPASTLNAACPSGLMVLRAALSCPMDPSTVVWCGGMDSMSTIPYLLKKCRFQGFKMGNKTLEDGWSDSVDPVIEMGMGETAELLVSKYSLTAEAMADYAQLSHDRALEAWQGDAFRNECVPVAGLERDETPRKTDLAQLMALRPVFGGKITAGTACAMADAAACYLVADKLRFPKQPCFEVREIRLCANDPRWMGTGPGHAIRELLSRQGLTADQLDVIEINEAFAAQMLANLKDAGLTADQVNRRGGAIALGHPTGMSGARLLVTLMDQMLSNSGSLGLAAICGAGGVTGIALLERIR